MRRQPVYLAAMLVAFGYFIQWSHDYGSFYALGYLLRSVVVGTLRIPGRLIRHARAAPAWAASMYHLIIALLIIQGINYLIGGVDGVATPGRIARTHHLLENPVVSPAMRQLVDVTARRRHNLAFIANTLSPDDTIDLSRSLALGTPVFVLSADPLCEVKRVDANERVTMLDTGAGVDASDGKHNELANSRRSNALAVSTANGLIVPPFKNDFLVATRNQSGKKTNIIRRGGVVFDSCPHTLISGGKMAAEDGIGTYLARALRPNVVLASTRR